MSMCLARVLMFVCVCNAAVVLVSQGLTANDNDTENDHSSGVSTESIADLPKEELESLEAQALDGCVAAADRVLLYYMTRDGSQRSTEEMVFWATIAAENGSPAGQYNLALIGLDIIGTKANPRLARRSCYWLKRASESGSEGADDDIESFGCKKLWSGGSVSD